MKLCVPSEAQGQITKIFSDNFCHISLNGFLLWKTSCDGASTRFDFTLEIIASIANESFNNQSIFCCFEYKKYVLKLYF